MVCSLKVTCLGSERQTLAVRGTDRVSMRMFGLHPWPLRFLLIAWLVGQEEGIIAETVEGSVCLRRSAWGGN